jgi:hypothetical protein
VAHDRLHFRATAAAWLDIPMAVIPAATGESGRARGGAFADSTAVEGLHCAHAAPLPAFAPSNRALIPAAEHATSTVSIVLPRYLRVSPIASDLGEMPDMKLSQQDVFWALLFRGGVSSGTMLEIKRKRSGAALGRVFLAAKLR